MGRDHIVVFYDGYCGLCHRAVRFALKHDPKGSLFRFAPLQGITFTKLSSIDSSQELADSIVVLEADDTLSHQSDAVILILEEVGGGWRRIGRALALVPRVLRDLFYRGIANTRHLVFRRPATLCPVLPPDLVERFLP